MNAKLNVALFPLKFPSPVPVNKQKTLHNLQPTDMHVRRSLVL